MTLTITGATGAFGRSVVETLLARGVPARDVVATGRAVEDLDDLAARGVSVRRADYDDPDSLRAAFAGAERLLLVSGTQPGRRVLQHRNAVEAAAASGVALVAYTSLAHAATSSLLLAEDHRQTEAVLAESGLPHVLLRNSWYLENYLAQLPMVLDHGVITGAAGDGRVSAALRAELAEAAAVVLLESEPAGQVLELGGEGFTLAQLAAAVAAASRQPVAYVDLTEDALREALVSAGLDPGYAAALADADRGLSQGDLYVDPGELARLLGRPATSMPEAVARALAALRG